MLSSNFNGSFQFQPQSNQQFATSVDSTSGSIGANSLLTAANTLIFNSPSQQNASSLSGSYIKSPFVAQHLVHSSSSKSLSQSPKLQKLSSSGSFSRQLLQLQQSNQTSDLDFDLHYNVPQADLSLNGENAKKAFKTNNQSGDFVFNDDDDQLDLDDNLNDNDDDLEDDSSNSNMFYMKRMSNETKQTNESTANHVQIGKILDNPIGYSSNRLLQNQSMNMPIEQAKLQTDSKSVNNDNLVNSIKKVNFLDETSPINSLSSYVG